jgi:citrate synthase
MGYVEKCSINTTIEAELFDKYNVKRGLREKDGKGVVVGLTEISEVQGFKYVDGVRTACEGELFYRGINIYDLVDGFLNDGRHGYEETIYLLLFGVLPNKEELDDFIKLLSKYRSLPKNFVRDILMKASGKDMMNSLARSVLTLYAYDDKADDTSIPNVLRQSLQLISEFPLLAVYAYHAYEFYEKKNSLVIRPPKAGLSTAENFLYMLRKDGKYTPLEARILDVALVLHAEHGGGNNSTFTTHVVSSSGTDTYSTVAASLGSLKGPRHGGANIKAMEMMADIKRHVKDWKDDQEIENYLSKMLAGEAYDHSGLIYGMGHAVYSISDPRAQVFKGFVEKLAIEKGRTKEMDLYHKVEEISQKLICAKRKVIKGVSANIDFYSGFVYNMLELPVELYTPMFAISRMSGWCAHRIEELHNNGKIIRPAYVSTNGRHAYEKIEDRK